VHRYSIDEDKDRTALSVFDALAILRENVNVTGMQGTVPETDELKK